MMEEMKQLGMTKLSEVEYHHIEELAESQHVEQTGRCKGGITSIMP